METVEKVIEEISTKVTDYGYNDEYGYYNDWKDGVKPIISNIKPSFLSSQLSIIQAIDEWAGKNNVLLHIDEKRGDNIGVEEEWGTGYNTALSDLHSFLNEAKKLLK